MPDNYFDCKKWPDKPGPNATDIDAGAYIIRGHAAWKSCSTALSDLKGMKVKLVND